MKRRSFLSLLFGAGAAAVAKPVAADPWPAVGLAIDPSVYGRSPMLQAIPEIEVSHRIRSDLTGMHIEVYASNGSRSASMLIDSFRDLSEAKETVRRLMRERGWLREYV